MYNIFVMLLILGSSLGYQSQFMTKYYQIGIEYDHSLPMMGRSNKYRHRNNYDPFFVTVTATAKKGFVLDFLQVTATVDAGGELDFKMVQGDVGSTKMTFQLFSNHSDFLRYSFMAYGIREADYRKMANHIILPITTNEAQKIQSTTFYTVILAVLSMLLCAR